MKVLNGNRLAAIGGLLFVVTTLVSAFIVSPPPDPDSAPAKFLTYYNDHRNVLLAQMIIALAANIPAVLFAAGLWSILKRGEPDGHVLGTAAVLSFLGAGAVISTATVTTGLLGFLGDGNGLDESSAHIFTVLASLMNVGIFSWIAGAALFSGWRFLEGTTAPKWVGALGLVVFVLNGVAMCSVAKSGAFAPFGIFSFGAFLLFSVYVLVISFFLWRRAPAAA